MAMDRTSVFLMVAVGVCVAIIIGLVYGIVDARNQLAIVENRLEEEQAKKEEIGKARTDAEAMAREYAILLSGRESLDVNIERSGLNQRRILEHIAKQVAPFAPAPVQLRPQYTNLKEVVDDLLNANWLVSERLPEAHALAEEKEKALATTQDDKREAEKQWTQQRRQLNDRINQERSEKESMRRAHEERVAQLNQQLDQAKREKEDMETRVRIERAELKSRIAQLEMRLKEVLRKKPKDLMSADADGRIYNADMPNRLCWIGLGRQHHVMPGMVFEVFREGKGGQRVFKGRVEVLKIEDAISKCSILQCYDEENDPVVRGDYIMSPLYDRERPMVFVLLGDFKNPYYTREQLKNKLKRYNCRVDSHISVETDWVVLGENAEKQEEYEKARDWHIPFMLERDLLRYLMR